MQSIDTIFQAWMPDKQQIKLLESIYKHLPVGVAIYDKIGNLLSINDAFLNIVGMDRPQVLSKLQLFTEIQYPEKEMGDVKEGKEVHFEIEYDFSKVPGINNYPTKLSVKKILDIFITPITDDNGDIDIYLQVCKDISKRVGVERNIIEMKYTFQFALESANMSTWEYFIEDRIFKVTNPIDGLGSVITVDEHFSRIQESFRDNSKKNFENVCNGKLDKSQSIYMFVDSVTNTPKYRQTYFASVKEDGVVKRVIGLSQDISWMYEQNMLIETGQRQLHLALDAGEIAAWTYDVPNRIFKTLYGNAIAGDGISMEGIMKVIHPDDVAKLKDVLNRLIDGVSEREISIIRFRADDFPGGYRFYDSRMMGRKENGSVVEITGTQRDVSESYIYQKKLEEDRLKTALINKACNIIQWDYIVDKKCVNTYTPESILPNTDIPLDEYLQFIHPDDREHVRSVFLSADMVSGEFINEEWRIMLPGNKDYKMVAISAVAILGVDGRVVKYTGIRRDVSKWMELNEEIRKKSVINDLILNNINTYLTFLSHGCEIQWTNLHVDSTIAKAMKMSSVSKGAHCAKWVDGKCLDPVNCALFASVEEERTIVREKKTNDGYVIESTAIPIYDNGKFLGTLVKMEDVTDNRKMFRELRSAKEEADLSSQLLNVILDSIPGAIFIKDASNGLVYTKANMMFCHSIDKDVSQIIGKTDSQIFPRSFAEKVHIQDMRILKEESKILSYELELNFTENPIFWQISKSLIYTEDGKILILSIATDVTNLHAINSELITARQQAEASDKLKSAFLANMSHEIRTPLNSIVGFSDLLIETDNPEEKAEYSRRITSNSEMLLHLIGDILDLSKIESGVLEFKRESVDVSGALQELCESFKTRITNPDLKLVVDVPYDHCYITLDKSKIEQVVTNFFNNALKYTYHGTITVGYMIENNGLLIYVEDTGVGIPKDKQNRVFSRFDKLDSFVQGTGLGLSIAKALCEADGGRIGFESEEGKGSRFWGWKPFTAIKLNIDHEEEANAPIIQSPTHSSQKAIRKVLVAEDNDSNFMLTEYILSDFEIKRAVNGEEAVKMTYIGDFDLILMDIKMPVMDGLEATSRIRKFNPSIPIVALTANAFLSDQEAAFAAGCDVFIPKPIKKKDLLQVIASLAKR